MSAISRSTQCRRCNRSILTRTAERHEGLCARCAGPNPSSGIFSALEFAGWLTMLPFLFLLLLVRLAFNYTTQFIPGTRSNLLKKFQTGWQPNFDHACRIWSRANCCFEGPVGYSAIITPEYLLVQIITQDITIDSGKILRAIDWRLPMLAAYCITVLENRGEITLLNKLPDDIAKSRAPIQSQCGCIGLTMALCDRWKQSTKRLRDRQE